MSEQATEDRRAWLERAWRDGQRAFAGAHLERLDLSRTSLPGCDFSGATLDHANLHQADLSDTTLADASLLHTNLHTAVLNRALLTRARLFSAQLQTAKLARADLQHADLRQAQLYGADLQHADLRHARLQGANLLRAKLDRAALTGALYDPRTRWPRGFDPDAHGAVRVALDPSSPPLPKPAPPPPPAPPPAPLAQDRRHPDRFFPADAEADLNQARLHHHAAPSLQTLWLWHPPPSAHPWWLRALRRVASPSGPLAAAMRHALRGRLVLHRDRLVLHLNDHATPASLDLNAPFQATLAAWLASDTAAHLTLTLRRVLSRPAPVHDADAPPLRVRVLLPQASLSALIPLQQTTAPFLDPDDLRRLWPTLALYASAHGQPFPSDLLDLRADPDAP